MDTLALATFPLLYYYIPENDNLFQQLWRSLAEAG